MEKGSTILQLDTILKVLVPLGKTLAVVPLETVSKIKAFNRSNKIEKSYLIEITTLKKCLKSPYKVF